MPSIFDDLFGKPINGIAGPTAAPSMLNPLDPAALRKAQLQDSLAGFSAGLLAAGGPSATPNDFGTALGKGLAGAAAGKEAGEDKYLKRALVGSLVATAQDKMKQRQALSALLLDANGPSTPAAGAIDPSNPVGGLAGGGPSNPTNPGNVTNGQGGFNIYKTPEEGVAAALKLAQSYPGLYNNGQPMTLAQIESHWSPPDNGKDPLTKGNKQGVWSGNVARAMGVDPNTPVDFSNPAMGLAFTKAVHQAEHPPGSAYAPEVYQRGASMAYGQAQAPMTGNAVAQPPGVVPVANPVPQGDSVSPVAPAQPSAQPSPIPGPPAVGAPAAQNIKQVIQGLKPAERQLLATMDPEDVTKFLLQRTAPNHETVLDTRDGTVKFVDKTDPLIGSVYQPVKAAELGISMRQAAAQEKQAEERAEANRIRNRNEPVTIDPATGQPVANPVLPDAKAGITRAEETAKVAPALLKYQGEEAIKDHQLAQQGAAKARSSNSNLAQLNTLLDGIDTGKGKATTTELKAWAKGAGINLDALGVKDDVAPIQAANKLLSQMALEARSTAEGGGMPGSMSDSDRQFLVGMTPGVETTPEGRKLIVDFMKNVNNRAIDAARIKNDYVRSGKFTTDPAGMWAEIDKKYSPTLADGKPNPDYVPLVPPGTKMPSAAPSGMPTMNAIDAEIERRRQK